jgi:hypothetical protein
MLIKKQSINLTPYFVGLILLAMSLPLSKYTTGLFHFFLAVVWLFNDFHFEADHSNKSTFFQLKNLVLGIPRNFILKLKTIGEDRVAMVAISMYFLFASAFFWGGDLNYILTDLRVKLPLIILPIIIFSMKPLNGKQFKLLLLIYVGAVIVGTLFSANLLFSQSFTEIRQISLFISPVRFALNICLSIVILAHFLFHTQNLKWLAKLLLIISILWLIFILFKLESGIGMIILFSLIFIFSLRKIYASPSLGLKASLGIFIIALPIVLFIYLNGEVKRFYNTPEINIETLELKTSNGNLYLHDTTHYLIEDGKFTGLYLCEKELKASWEKRSKMKYEGKDLKGQELKSTLIRYLSSKNLHKDKIGLQSLSSEDIQHIENGIANYRYIFHPGLKTRISKIIFAYEVYRKTSNPNGSSLAQRSEYWSASLNLIQEHPWLGIGSGHITTAFENQFKLTKSKLLQENRMESHNQYLLVLVSFGIMGFIWFMFVLLYPGLKTKAFSNALYLAFIIIILISMLSEDTLETQTGLSFFAFFNILFISQYRNKSISLD